MESREKMIQELRDIGVEVVFVPKALIPDNMGTPYRDDRVVEEMDIETAYKRYCLSPMRNYDPFSY